MKIENTLVRIVLVIVIGALAYLFIININYQKNIKELNTDITTLKDEYKDLKKRVDEVNPPTKSVEETDFTTIKPSEIAELSKGKTIVVMIGRSDCGWCHRFIPVLEEASKEYKFNAKYVDLYGILNSSTWAIDDNEEYEKLLNISATEEYESFMEENFGSTPLTIIVKDGQIINAISGYVTIDELSSKLEDSGLKK